MPIGKATSQVTIRVTPESRTVRPKRSHISSETGLFHSKDSPKSPRKRMPEIQSQYWTYQG